MKATTTRPGSRGRSRRTNNKATNNRPLPFKYDDDGDRQLTEYEDDDDDTMDEEVHSFQSSPEQPKSTTDVVEESNMQVLFSEMTSREMDEILQWWTSKAWVEDDDQTNLAPTNTLLHLAESKEEEDDEQATLSSENNEDNIIVSSRPLLVNLDGEEKTEPLNALADHRDEAVLEEEEPVVEFKTPQKATNLLVDQPLPQDVTFFSPFQEEQIGVIMFDTPIPDEASFDLSSEEMTICTSKSRSGPDELHESVCMQHDEVTRLLFQTNAMADQVAALTESSATEDDNDDCYSVGSEVSEMISKLPPRRSIRRRRRKTVNADIAPLEPTSSEDSTFVKLEWHHYGRIWLFRQLMKLEMVVVSEVLVPLLPLPCLLRVLHRPKTFRSFLLTLLLLVTVVLPLFVWWYLPTHTATTKAPLPSLELFFNYEPYYASELRYSLQASSTNVVREVAVFVEGEADFGFL